MHAQGKLVLFCGPSGSGKTTLVQHLLRNNTSLAFSVSATTRPMRSEEVDGIDYHFISVEEFKRRITRGEFIEWEEVYKDRFYGTLKTEIDRIWKEKKVVVFDVDVEGGLKLKKTFGDAMLAVFVMPPSIDELHHRLKARNSESVDSFRARTAKSEHELSFASQFDHVIVNDQLNQALQDAVRIVDLFLTTA